MLRLVISADARSILPHQVVQFEHEREDLVQCDLQPVVGTIQEALVQDAVQVVVVQRNHLFKVVDLGKSTFEQCPLGLDNCYHDVLFYGVDEVVHLLAEELEFAQLSVLLSAVDLPELT